MLCEAWPPSSRSIDSPSTSAASARSTTSPSASPRARSSGSWAPTAPARRPRSASSWGCCTRTGAPPGSAATTAGPTTRTRRGSSAPRSSSRPYGFLSGRDNLRQFARILGRVDEAHISELLDLVGMTERADDKVKRYSMGMRQRVALAQGMLGKPRLLILDEPTNGLDPNGIHGLRVLLRKLATEQGMTIFFSSHLLSEVEELCDRVVVLHRGEVRAAGPLDELMTTKGFKYRIDVSDVDQALEILRTMDGARAEPGTIKDSINVSADH